MKNTGKTNMYGSSIRVGDIANHRWAGKMIVVWNEELKDYVYASFENGAVNLNGFMLIEGNLSVSDVLYNINEVQKIAN